MKISPFSCVFGSGSQGSSILLTVSKLDRFALLTRFLKVHKVRRNSLCIMELEGHFRRSQNPPGSQGFAAGSSRHPDPGGASSESSRIAYCVRLPFPPKTTAMYSMSTSSWRWIRNCHSVQPVACRSSLRVTVGSGTGLSGGRSFRMLLALPVDDGPDLLEEAPPGGREFIEATGKGLARDPVDPLQVLLRDLHVLDADSVLSTPS